MLKLYKIFDMLNQNMLVYRILWCTGFDTIHTIYIDIDIYKVYRISMYHGIWKFIQLSYWNTSIRCFTVPKTMILQKYYIFSIFGTISPLYDISMILFLKNKSERKIRKFKDSIQILKNVYFNKPKLLLHVSHNTNSKNTKIHC